MRRITTWLLSTISALVLLFSYHTSTSSAAATSIITSAGTGTTTGHTPSSSGPGSTDSNSSSGSSAGASASPSLSPRAGGTGSTSSAAKTYTGDAVSTRYGDVQVEITVKSGKITDAQVTQVPWSNRKDQEISSYSVPILSQEAVDQQSAAIDMVSGASYTSQGYIGSLQSAIDKAHL